MHTFAHLHSASIDSCDFAKSNAQVRAALSVGKPMNFEETVAALADLQLSNGHLVEIERDIAYGSHARQKFDWFQPSDIGEVPANTVLLFVHGGGFVRGNKIEPGTPFYDNIGIWAATHGMCAATMNYSLAPDHPWPAGGEDVLSAIAALSAHAQRVIGRAPRIFLMGHSAGAVHVATAMTLQPAPSEITACILASGFYDNTVEAPNAAYFGVDPEKFERQSSLAGLSNSDMPLFLIVGENDFSSLQRDAVAVMSGRIHANKPLPQFLVVDGSNHFSPVLLLNSEVDTVGPRLLEFIGRFAS